MKKTIIIALFIMIIPFAAQAEDEENNWRKSCEMYSSLAETVMEARQAGLPMSDMMDLVMDGSLRKLTEEFIIEAYKTPRYSSERMKREAVIDFKDDVYHECVTVLR